MNFKKFLSVFATVTTTLAAAAGIAFAVKKIADKKAEHDLFDDFNDEDFKDTFESDDEEDETKRAYVSIHIPSEEAENEAPVDDAEGEASGKDSSDDIDCEVCAEDSSDDTDHEASAEDVSDEASAEDEA